MGWQEEGETERFLVVCVCVAKAEGYPGSPVVRSGFDGLKLAIPLAGQHFLFDSQPLQG